MEVFKFSHNDLSSNKNGSLSESQKQRVLKFAIMAFSIFELVGVFFAGLILLASKKPLNETPLAIPGFFLVVFTIIGVSLAWLHWRTYRLGTVKRLSGKIEFQEMKGALFLCIDGARIRMLLDVVNLFEANSIYNIYYAPLIATVMSVEKVS